MRFKTKTVLGAALALIFLGAAVAGYIACRCDRTPRGAFQNGDGRLPPGFVAPPVKETSWLSFLGNEASEATAGFPAGSRVVRLETESGEVVEVGILPGGQVVTRKGVKATVYKKRPSLVKARIRPFVGAGAVGPQPNYAVAAGVDVLRVWRINLGAGVLINDDAVAGAAFAAYPLWRNIDLRVGGGYGTAGGVGFAGVSLAIE